MGFLFSWKSWKRELRVLLVYRHKERRFRRDARRSVGRPPDIWGIQFINAPYEGAELRLKQVLCIYIFIIIGDTLLKFARGINLHYLIIGGILKMLMLIE